MSNYLDNVQSSPARNRLLVGTGRDKNSWSLWIDATARQFFDLKNSYFYRLYPSLPLHTNVTEGTAVAHPIGYSTEDTRKRLLDEE